MSRVLPNQTNITPTDAFFLRANVSTLVVNNLSASNITALTGSISSLTNNYLESDFISTTLLEADSISSLNLETNYAEISSIFVLDGFISSFITNNIILDGNTLDTGGQGSGAALLLNGLSIAKGTSSLSSIQDWSFFPAVSTLQMSGNNINNAGNITSQNVYNALNVQTDTLAVLTSATTPSLTATNIRTTNLSSVNTVLSNATVSGAVSGGSFSGGSFTGGTGSFTGLSSLTVSTATVNGQPFISGSNWSQYPAVQTVSLATFGLSNTSNLNINAARNISMSNPSGGLTNWDTTITTGDFTVVADQGLDVSEAANLNLTAQGGTRGLISLTANAGGVNSLFGQIDLTANGGNFGGIGTGGLINITANTPIGLSNLTSAIKMSAAGINSYAGAIPSFGSLAGYNYIHGDLGVNITSGLVSLLPNTAGTTYIYGTNGVEIPSDLYLQNIYPYWDGITTPPDINITGRYILPNLAQVCVRMSNVRQIDFQSNVTTFMSNCDNIGMTPNGIITTSNITAQTGTIGTLSNTSFLGSNITASNGTIGTLSNTFFFGSNIYNTTLFGNGSNGISGYFSITADLMNPTTLLASSNISIFASTATMRLSSINGFASFGQQSMRIQGDVAQIQLSNNNPAGQGTRFNVLSRTTYSELQSGNSNFTQQLPLVLTASYTSTGSMLVSSINGQSLPYAYGSFTANSNQTIGVPNTAVSTIFDTTEISLGGVSVVGGVGTRVAVSTGGTYRFLASPQFDTTSGGQNTVDFWFQKNGVAVPRSASKMTIQNNGEVFSSVETILPMNAQDYIETCFTSADTNMNLASFAASGVVPAVPGCIFNVQKIADV